MTNFIFDFNGTLYQDTLMHLSAWRRFYERRGVPFTDDLFYRYMCGPPNSAILRRMIDPALTDGEIDALSEEKEELYRQVIRDDPSLWHLTPGAEAMLDRLKALGVPYAIATGAARPNIDFYMDVLKIDRWFDYGHIFYAEHRMPGKPDPAIYRLAMQQLGFHPEDTVVVEDALAGIQSAAGAGVRRIIAIDTTLGPEAFRDIPEVIAVIHDFHDFDRYID